MEDIETNFDMGSIILPVVIIAIILIIVVAAIMYSKKKHGKNVTCQKCNTKMTFDNVTNIEEISRRNSTSTSLHGNGQKAYSVYATYRVTLLCPNCGEEKTFTREIRILHDDGVLKEINPADVLRTYINKGI